MPVSIMSAPQSSQNSHGNAHRSSSERVNCPNVRLHRPFFVPPLPTTTFLRAVRRRRPEHLGVARCVFCDAVGATLSVAYTAVAPACCNGSQSVGVGAVATTAMRGCMERTG